jgi:tripartite-type tricarboxylate transporter receptor subunit TctC
MDLSGSFYGHGSRPRKLPEAGRSSAARNSEVGVRRSLDTYVDQSLARILKQPELQERLRADGRQTAHSTPEEFARVIAREITKWKTVVKVGNIKVD